jgi:hypothetical protein
LAEWAEKGDPGEISLKYVGVEIDVLLVQAQRLDGDGPQDGQRKAATHAEHITLPAFALASARVTFRPATPRIQGRTRMRPTATRLR